MTNGHVRFRTRRFGRFWLLRLVAVSAIVSLLLTYAATSGTIDWGVETIGGIMVVLQVALIIVLTPSLGASLISAERESGGWELLRMTPLSAASILLGKLASVLLTLLLLMLATLPGYLVMIWIHPPLRWQVWQALICLAWMALLAMLLSAAVGSLCRRPLSQPPSRTVCWARRASARCCFTARRRRSTTVSPCSRSARWPPR